MFAIQAWRDVAARYKKTAFEVDWALIRAFLPMVVTTPEMSPNASTQKMKPIW
jgi:hypothetical protein